MHPIQLTLTLDETNLLLEGLGQLPYVRVYGLINKLQQQAMVSLKEEQLTEPGKNGSGGPLIEQTGEIR